MTLEPVSSIQGLAPFTAIEIELCPLVTATPVPALIVAANGAPALDPIINCPSVNASHVGTPVAFVLNAALLVVASPLTVFAELA